MVDLLWWGCPLLRIWLGMPIFLSPARALRHDENRCSQQLLSIRTMYLVFRGMSLRIPLEAAGRPPLATKPMRVNFYAKLRHPALVLDFLASKAKFLHL